MRKRRKKKAEAPSFPNFTVEGLELDQEGAEHEGNPILKNFRGSEEDLLQQNVCNPDFIPGFWCASRKERSFQ